MKIYRWKKLMVLSYCRTNIFILYIFRVLFIPGFVCSNHRHVRNIDKQESTSKPSEVTIRPKIFFISTTLGDFCRHDRQQSLVTWCGRIQLHDKTEKSLCKYFRAATTKSEDARAHSTITKEINCYYGNQ